MWRMNKSCAGDLKPHLERDAWWSYCCSTEQVLSLLSPSGVSPDVDTLPFSTQKPSARIWSYLWRLASAPRVSGMYICHEKVRYWFFPSSISSKSCLPYSLWGHLVCMQVTKYCTGSASSKLTHNCFLTFLVWLVFGMKWILSTTSLPDILSRCYILFWCH